MGSLKRRKTIGDEDRISRLPDDVLGDIISLLPTRDGARTQVISSRWRNLWRSAPLNIDFTSSSFQRSFVGEVSCILSAHKGPGRRFSVPSSYLKPIESSTATLDSWLRSPALNNLQELKFCYGFPRWETPGPPLAASVLRFSSTLRVADFGGFGGFPDGTSASALHFPVLKQLSLRHVSITDSSLEALLAGCPVLETLLIDSCSVCNCLRIDSHSLRSIDVITGRGLLQVIIMDASCLERLLLQTNEMVGISVVSAPKLSILRQLCIAAHRLPFGTAFFQGSQLVSLTTVVPSVKVLALTNHHLSLDAVIDFMKCLPCLEKLYMETFGTGEKNVWCRKYRNLISTLDIGLKKIVLLHYRGNQSHVNFAKFFVQNAKVLELMVLELDDSSKNRSDWIARQHRLLQTNNRASLGARFDFALPPRFMDSNRLAHLN